MESFRHSDIGAPNRPSQRPSLSIVEPWKPHYLECAQETADQISCSDLPWHSAKASTFLQFEAPHCVSTGRINDASKKNLVNDQVDSMAHGNKKFAKVWSYNLFDVQDLCTIH